MRKIRSTGKKSSTKRAAPRRGGSKMKMTNKKRVKGY